MPANGTAAGPRSRALTATTLSPSLLTAFPTESLASDLSVYGSDQDVAPPDTQLAAGPTDLVSAVNDAMWVWTKNGVVRGSVDLNTFFAVPTGYSFTDPRVVYDAPTSRWFVSGLAFDSSTDSKVYVATSQTSDPTGLYSVYVVSSKAGVVQDQPKVGLDSAVVVLSWNDFTGTTFSGQETKVIEKADLLAGASTVHLSSFPLDTTRFGIVPVQSLSSTSTEYLVYNDSCGTNTTGGCTTSTSALGRVAITGTPALGNVAWTEADPAITPTTTPPAADEPGRTAFVQTNDDRFLTAISDGTTIYLSGNDGCVPTGDSVARPCARLIEVAVGSTATVTLDSVLACSGADLYFPAVAPDVSGNVFLSATYSSTTTYPAATGLTLASGASSFSTVAFQSGSGANTDGRWGDYSGIAVDPSNPTDIWMAAEYAPSSDANWGTAVGEVTLSPPPPPFSPQGVGAPSVAIDPSGAQLIFWQGAGGHLMEAWWNGSWNGPVDWTAANHWAPSLTSAPSVALAPDGTQIIFWQGAGGHLYEAWWKGSWNGPVAWTAANHWPASVTSAPSVTFNAAGTQLIFWQAAGGHLDEVWWNGSWNGPVDWTAANHWPASVTSAPSVAIDPSGTQLIFWKGAGGHLDEVWWNGSWNGPVDWTAAKGWAPSLTSAPSVAFAPDGTQLIFWQGAGGHLFEVWWNGSWNGPVDWTAANRWPATMTSAPSVVFSGSTQLIFWQGTGGHLIEVWWNGSWNGPVDWSG